MDMWDVVASSFAPSTDDSLRFPTPGDLAQYMSPNTVQTPALKLIDKKLVEAYETPDKRLIITMPPQEGKSVRVASVFPAWVLLKNPNMRIVTASYGQSLATRNGKAVRRHISGHPELGWRIARDSGSAYEWQLDGFEGGLYSVGVTGGVTGRPADLVIIDDPIKSSAEAESEAHRDKLWDWWVSEVAARLAPGASVVMILTRWHHDDLAGRFLKDESQNWELVNIPAQANYDPDKGEEDPLGRLPGEFMISARGRTEAQWQARKAAAGERVWQALYQGDPTPVEGTLFNLTNLQYYDRPMWLERPDGSNFFPLGAYGGVRLLQSWDMAFKDVKTADFVVGQVWAQKGAQFYLIDQVRGRWNFSETCEQVRQLTQKWPQATLKLVEDRANGTAVMNMLKGRVAGLVAVEPQGGKEARAASVSPLIEAGNVFLPDVRLAPWLGDFLTELRQFPYGKHDDQVDALTQALTRMAASGAALGQNTQVVGLD